jgi:copper resistance protein B
MRRRSIAAVEAVLGLWILLAPAAPVSAQDALALDPARAQTPDPHAGHTQPKPAGEPQAASGDLPPFIPPVTDADRAAAFPDVMGHAVHDSDVNWFVLFDQLEWHPTEGPDGLDWDTKGWIGKDRDRFWFRTEGANDVGRIREANAHLLYGRAIARWWDLVAGLRQDVEPGSPQTWAAVGVQGLAPYGFEVEATAYVGGSGRTQLRVQTEYDVLLSNRWILQPLVDAVVFGKEDPDRDVGAGLSSIDAGLRLRYLVRREFAPYVGVTWNWKFSGTKDLARADGDPASLVRLALGVRLWM